MFVRFKRCLQLRGASCCKNFNKHRLICPPLVFTSLKDIKNVLRKSFYSSLHFYGVLLLHLIWTNVVVYDKGKDKRFNKTLKIRLGT